MMEPAEDWYRCDAADEDFFNSLLRSWTACAWTAGDTLTPGSWSSQQARRERARDVFLCRD